MPEREPGSVTGWVESLNVGVPRPVEVNGDTVWTAIWKQPVEGRVPLRGVNLRGDDQADRSVHGGPDKAVYAYAAEDRSGGRRSSEDRSDRAPSGRISPSTGSPSPGR